MRVECNITLHEMSGTVNFRLDEVQTNSLTQRLEASIPLSQVISSGNSQHNNNSNSQSIT